MPPILIDSRDFIKLGFISILLIALIFAIGYFLGHQRAASFYLAGSEVHVLSLPQAQVVTEHILQPQLPTVIAAGEDIDVDSPESQKILVNSSNTQKSKVDVLTVNSADKILLDDQQAVVAATLPESISAVDAKASTVISKPQNKKIQITVENNVEAISIAHSAAHSAEIRIAKTFTADELNKIKYTIQVGMYGRLLNAENVMKLLQAQQYDAYVSDYTNKKNKIRYNVRFGYFEDKKTAIAALKKFKTQQKGEGYLVNFSAKNIVKIADVIDVKYDESMPTDNSRSKLEILPVTVPQLHGNNKVFVGEILNHLSATDLL